MTPSTVDYKSAWLTFKNTIKNYSENASVFETTSAIYEELFELMEKYEVLYKVSKQ